MFGYPPLLSGWPASTETTSKDPPTTAVANAPEGWPTKDRCVLITWLSLKAHMSPLAARQFSNDLLRRADEAEGKT